MALVTQPANLDTLPAEIIDHLFYFGNIHWRDMSWEEDQIRSLRLVNRSLESKTLWAFDVTTRQSATMIHVNLSPRGLEDLLHHPMVSSCSKLRERIRHVEIQRQRFPELDNGWWDGEDCVHFTEILLSEQWEYENSPEAFHVLAESFNQLCRTGIKTLVIGCGYNLCLRALQASTLKHQGAVLEIDPYVLGFEPAECLWKTVKYHKHLLRAVHLRTSPHSDYWGLNGAGNDPSVRLGLFNLYKSVCEVQELKVECRSGHWHPKFCHACDSLWRQSLRCLTYPNVRKLALNGMIISGTFLAKFLCQHSNTLKHVDVDQVQLYQGSWDKVLYAMLKRSPSHLCLLGLYQKNRKGRHTLRDSTGAHCSRFEGVESQGAQVRLFLEAMVRDFSLHPRSESNPGYNAVVLLIIPAASKKFKFDF